MVHGIVAAGTGHDHWELSEAERKELSRASVDVLRWYDIKQSQKTIDHITLAGLLWTMESKRIRETVRLNRQAAGGKPARPATLPTVAAPSLPSATVFTFKPGTNAPPVEMPAEGSA